VPVTLVNFKWINNQHSNVLATKRNESECRKWITKMKIQQTNTKKRGWVPKVLVRQQDWLLQGLVPSWRIVLFEFVWKKPFVSDQTSKSKLTAKKFDKTKQDEDPATKYEKRCECSRKCTYIYKGSNNVTSASDY